jgi:hypothetical protein
VLTRLAFKLGVIVTLSVILYFSYYLYFRTYAERIAREKVQQFCEEKGHDFKKLKGPVFSHALGLPEFDFLGCDFHPAVYGWNDTNENTNKELICDVWFDFFYQPHLIIWDMPWH